MMIIRNYSENADAKQVGALFNSRGPILGIPAALLLIQFNLIRWLPALAG